MCSNLESFNTDLQAYIKAAFLAYTPSPPETVSRSKHDVMLTWPQDGLQFLDGELLYTIERKEKLPPWVIEYSGSQTTKRIDNLMPCCPHKFRLKVIIKATAVPRLAELAVKYYGNEGCAWENLKEVFKNLHKVNNKEKEVFTSDSNAKGEDGVTEKIEDVVSLNIDGGGDGSSSKLPVTKKPANPWLESQYSEVITTNTEPVGASPFCFCMAVRDGYMKHVQLMLEERPELIGIINNSDGFTPLATAIRTGDMAMVRYLLSMGAEVDQRSGSWQTPLHLAVLSGNTAVADLLLEKGADFKIRDRNELRIEHYAVDSGNLYTLRFILDRGGDIHVKDNNGWTPLFRAVVQGASTAVIEELVRRGSDIGVVDCAGLSLMAAAKRLTDKHGKTRESVLRLVDYQYPRDKVLATFSRVTKKITSVHSLTKH